MKLLGDPQRLLQSRHVAETVPATRPNIPKFAAKIVPNTPEKHAAILGSLS